MTFPAVESWSHCALAGLFLLGFFSLFFFINAIHTVKCTPSQVEAVLAVAGTLISA